MPIQTKVTKKINLLPTEYIEPKRYKKINQLSYAILGLYLISMLGLFGYFLYLNYQKGTLQQKNQTLVQAVESQKSKEGLLVTLKDRINVAKAIFAQSSPSASELVNTIISLLPPDVTLMSVEADRDGKVLLIVKSTQSAGIAQLVSVIEQKQFKGVALNTLALNTEGAYVMSLDIRP